MHVVNAIGSLPAMKMGVTIAAFRIAGIKLVSNAAL